MILCLTVAACGATPDRVVQLPTTPAAFRGAATIGAEIPAPGEWWKVFADARLDALIARADTQNFSLRQAEARLAQARAARQAAAAARWPRLGLSANATRQDGALTNAAATTGNLFVLGANASYEVDLFNRLGRESDAATLDIAEREALLAAARLLVQTDIARQYFTLRGIDAERALLGAVVAAQRRSAEITEGLARAGLAAELAAVRLRAEAEALAEEALALDRRRDEAELALSVLVGEPAPLFRLAAQPAPWASPPVIPPGIPGTVLARRPDLRAARQAHLAAEARIGIARDAWLPNLTLTGLGGLAAMTLPALFASQAAASGLGALLAMPVIDGGRNAAGVARAAADRDLVAATYGQQILVALQEVEGQLAALRILAEQEAALERAIVAARRARALVASNQANGLASQLELLDAERTLLRDQRQALRIRAARLEATVSLVRALGGGWG